MTRRRRQTDDVLRDVVLERRQIRDILIHGMGARYADCTLSASAWSHPVYAMIWQVAAALDADGQSVDPVTVSTRAQHPDLSLAHLTRVAAGHDPKLDADGIAAAARRLTDLAEARAVVERLDATRQQVLTHPEAAGDALDYLASHHAETRATSRLLRLIDLEDVSTDGALIEGLLLPDSLAAIWGPSNAGKTALLHDLAVTLATGGVWCGRQCRPVPVAIVAYEGRYGLRNRLDAAAAARGVRDLASLDVYVYDRPPSLADAAGLSAMRREFIQRGILVPMIDTLTRACGGVYDLDAGSGGDAARVVAALEALRPPGATVVVSHHCGHDASRMRGAYALLAAIDTELHAADGVLVTRKQRDLPSDLRESYSLIPQDGTIVVGYGGSAPAVHDDLRERVVAALAAHPGASKSAIQRIVRGNRDRVFRIVSELREESGSGCIGTGAEPAEPRYSEVPGSRVSHTRRVGTPDGTGTEPGSVTGSATGTDGGRYGA